MGNKMNISYTRELVINALVKYPHLRDDDNRLLATIWAHELGGKDKVKEISAFEFLEKLSKGKLANSESVRRMRQKLQEDYENLRGPKYNERQARATQVKNDLKK